MTTCSSKNFIKCQNLISGGERDAPCKGVTDVTIQETLNCASYLSITAFTEVIWYVN
jgi:hypothetical protein